VILLAAVLTIFGVAGVHILSKPARAGDVAMNAP